MTRKAAAPTPAMPHEGRVRAVVEGVAPAVDGGRFAIKRVAGEEIVVEADCFTDGHDQIACLLLWRRAEVATWTSVPMHPLGNDRWRAAFTVDAPGSYRYTVAAWVDAFLSWRHDLARRIDPDDLRIAARVGAELLTAAAQRAVASGRGGSEDASRLTRWAAELRELHAPEAIRKLGLDDTLSATRSAIPIGAGRTAIRSSSP